METVSLKLEHQFAQSVEKAIKKHHYTTKTEFIREAMRDKLKQLELEEARQRVYKMYGASNRKTTDEELHKAREEAFEELEKQFQ